MCFSDEDAKVAELAARETPPTVRSVRSVLHDIARGKRTSFELAAREQAARIRAHEFAADHDQERGDARLRRHTAPDVLLSHGKERNAQQLLQAVVHRSTQVAAKASKAHIHPKIMQPQGKGLPLAAETQCESGEHSLVMSGSRSMVFETAELSVSSGAASA